MGEEKKDAEEMESGTAEGSVLADGLVTKGTDDNNNDPHDDLTATTENVTPLTTSPLSTTRSNSMILQPAASNNYSLDSGNGLCGDAISTSGDDLMETIDSCVVCADGVDIQHAYEEVLQKHDAHNEAHGLSSQEAALIRHQIMEANSPRSSRKATVATFELEDLNLCGDLADAKPPSYFPKDDTDAAPSSNGMLAPKIAEPTETVVGGIRTNALQCAMCFDEADVDRTDGFKVVFANLPCCQGKADSLYKVCTACVLLLSDHVTDGSSRVGRCPRCRSWIDITTIQKIPLQLKIEPIPDSVDSKCAVCNQEKTHLVENDAICDACFLGRKRQLQYECKECHTKQRIPHPIYRYQKSLEDYGTKEWRCQGECNKFTAWRIIPDEVKFIPVGDIPDSWGEDMIAIARTRVQEARKGIVENPLLVNSAEDGCCIQ